MNISVLALSALCLLVTPALGQNQGQAASQDEAFSELVQPLQRVLAHAEELLPLETLIIAKHGKLIVDQGFRGHITSATANIKSASKSVISALVGMAIEREVLEGTDQKIAPILTDKLPVDADPRLSDITIGHLLSMQAGLEPTSGSNYGRWIMSPDWVAEALKAPLISDPGDEMLYSTGSTHLLSAILTRVSKRSTLELAREWFAPVKEFRIGHWMRDRQGIYFGGNQMAMSPRSMLAFGELYRNGGQVVGAGTGAGDGAEDATESIQVLSKDWIEHSWTVKARSTDRDDDYGYGWYITDMVGHRVNYAWGFGGQMIYVCPSLGLTVVMTSDEKLPSASSGYKYNLDQLMQDIILASIIEDREEEAAANALDAAGIPDPIKTSSSTNQLPLPHADQSPVDKLPE